MYHAVGVDEGPGVDPHYSVTLPLFKRHMQACTQACGPLACVQDWFDGRGGVILTFDDGHESNHRLVWPALAEIGGRADFFVNPAQVGTAGFATWPALREMAAGGMSIQSHGLDHRHYLTELSPDLLRDELRRAKLDIENHTGQSVTLLSPPGGRRPRDLEQIAAEIGYKHILDSRPATIRRRPRRTLGRFAVTSQLDIPTLESWLPGGPGRLKMEGRYLMLAAAKRIFGDRTYERIRQSLLGKDGQ